MAQQVDVKGFGLVEFPDNTDRLTMLNALRHKFSQMPANETGSRAEPYQRNLGERLSGGISSALQRTGLVSDNYGANRIGDNIGMALNALPVIGDAIGGDELGRAIKQGDAGGIGFAALGAIPVAGDAVKAARQINFDAVSKPIANLMRSNKDFEYDDEIRGAIYSGKDSFFTGDKFDEQAYLNAASTAEENLSEPAFNALLNSDTWLGSNAVRVTPEDYEKLTKQFTGTEIHHGTPYDFDDIELRSDGGAFFTTNKKSAQHYAADGGTVKSYKIEPKNPLFITHQDATYDIEGTGVLDEVKAAGFDSIIPISGGDIVVLDTAILKK